MKRMFRLSRLVAVLRATMAAFPDRRTGDNSQYSMQHFGMTAFSTFFMQSPSWRSHQTWLDQLERNGNAGRLFGLEAIPCANQVRTVLDEVAPVHVHPMYDEIFRRLDRSGLLRQLRGFQQDLLIPLDGTQYFSSKAIWCENCSTKTHKDGSVTYSHSALLPAIVVPGEPFVLPLAPEFITPQDGHTKQDCEVAAAKRWMTDFRRRHKIVAATVLGDDLYSRQPMCETALAQRFNFIFVCKPSSHPTLYARIAELQRDDGLQTKEVRCFREGRWECDHYAWAGDVPLRAGNDALLVNWIDLTTTVEATQAEVYHNSFVTNHAISVDTAEAVVVTGRSRWKIENEEHNPLKNHGYNLTHNYGHGEKFLSSLLVSLMLMAFLLHALLDLVHAPFHRLRTVLPSRREVFTDLRALLRYLPVETLSHLFAFMVSQLDRDYAPG
jgi:hypothetical protein